MYTVFSSEKRNRISLEMELNLVKAQVKHFSEQQDKTKLNSTLLTDQSTMELTNP